uniref:Uncharacterized protein At4g00291 n=1 Tax=Arabidopsis thaliana TaxID=3702 RepID=Q67XQ7_ARATH|nr:unknown protein [Arabidopsis thaliana]
MAGVRLSLLKSIQRSIKPHATAKSCSGLLNSHARAFTCGNLLDGPKASPSMISFSSNIRLHNDAKPFNYLGHSSYARAFSSKSDVFGSIVASGVTGSGDGNGDGNDWVEKAKDVLQTSVDAVTETAKKTKDVSDEMIPHVQQILRRFHTYAMQSSAKLLPVGFSNEDVPYEKSFWGALEDPARYLVTFIAFAQIAAMVAPTTIAAQYFSPTVKGAVILSLVWFLYRWKTNVITRMLSAKSFGGLDREKG